MGKRMTGREGKKVLLVCRSCSETLGVAGMRVVEAKACFPAGRGLFLRSQVRARGHQGKDWPDQTHQELKQK